MMATSSRRNRAVQLAVAWSIVFCLAESRRGHAQEPTASPPEQEPVATEHEMFHKYVVATLGGDGVLGASLAAAFDQWRDDPVTWDADAGGYAKRWASDYASAAIGESTKYAFARLLHHDPSFQRCQCASFGRRLHHAVDSPFMARRPDGRRVVSPATIAGILAGSLIPLVAWYPASNRGWSAVQHTGSAVAAKIGVDVFREFVHIRPPR